MIGTVLIAVLVIAVGARATDAVRLRQQEIILGKLPTPEAAAFYRVLQRRAWKVRILRAVALASLVALLYSRNQARSRRAVAPDFNGAAEVGGAAGGGYLPQRR